MKIDIMGVELDLSYDLTDADGAKHWEEKVGSLTEQLIAVEKKTGITQSQVIQEEISVTKKWLDQVFGAESGSKVFDGRENLKTVYVVQNLMRNLHAVYIPRILNDAWTEALKQYSPERAQRKKK